MVLNTLTEKIENSVRFAIIIYKKIF